MNSCFKNTVYFQGKQVLLDSFSGQAEGQGLNKTIATPVLFLRKFPKFLEQLFF